MSVATVNLHITRAALTAVLVCAAAWCASSTVADQSNSAPLRLSFDKTAVADGVWAGTISGDIEGTLTTVLRDVRVTGKVWHVNFDWIIDSGDQSFTANLSGILNLKTGSVVMNGTIVEGYLTGAQVHEEGQLVNAATLQFVGSIQIMPATTD